MKKVISLLFAALMMSAALVGCGSVATDVERPSEPTVAIKNSPDKYTWYIKSYVGKNCASIGYASLGGDRMDEYGNWYIKLVLVTPDGAYIDIETDDDLKQYVVTGQSLAPNTELTYTFSTDSEGNEYSFAKSQNIKEIELTVEPIDAG